MRGTCSFQEFLASVDTDKECVTELIATVQGRWQSVERLTDSTSKSLEERTNQLSEHQDMINDLTKQVKEYEDILASHNALGATAYDNKHVEHIKVFIYTYIIYSFWSVL